MGDRLALDAILRNILGSGNVYFQPPANVSIEYPCIVYSLDFAFSEFADNSPHMTNWRYQVIYIDRRPDSPVVKEIMTIPTCVYDRSYVADNLNHYSFKLYF